MINFIKGFTEVHNYEVTLHENGIYLEIKFADIPREKFTWNLSQVNLN